MPGPLKTLRRTLITASFAAFFLTIGGCGGNTSNTKVNQSPPPPALAMNGNWGFEGTPGGTGTVMDATLTTSGGKLAGGVSLFNQTCYGVSYAVTGTLSSAGAVTLTAQGLSITGTITNGVFDGTWTDAQCSPSGTTPRPLTGYPVPSLVGTWTGAASGGLTPYPMAATITSETNWTLTGSAQVSNSPCMSAAITQLTDATVVGMSVVGTLQTTHREIFVFGTVAPGGNTINGTYSVVGGTSNCVGSLGTFYLNRN